MPLHKARVSKRRWYRCNNCVAGIDGSVHHFNELIAFRICLNLGVLFKWTICVQNLSELMLKTTLMLGKEQDVAVDRRRHLLTQCCSNCSRKTCNDSTIVRVGKLTESLVELSRYELFFSVQSGEPGAPATCAAVKHRRSSGDTFCLCC